MGDFFGLTLENELFKKDAFYQAIVNNFYDAIYILDINNTIIYSNHSVKRVLGIEPGEMLGKRFTDFVHPDDIYNVQKILSNSKTGKQAYNICEFKIKHKDSKWLWVQSASYKLFKNETTEAIVVSIIDITEKKLLERKLKEIREQLAILQNKSLSEYAYITSAKLRAPLTNILGLSNLLHDFSPDQGEDFQNLKTLLLNLQQQAEKLDKVIYDINSIVSTNVVKGNARMMDRKIEHIVLIDDEPVANLIHEKVIAKAIPEGQLKVISSFTTPEEAFSYIQRIPPDLIFLDIDMPKVGAWEFLQRMEKDNLDIDVIIISSSINPADREKAMAFPSVKNFFNKPLKLEDIEDILNK